jgi:hypothetical protein
MSRTSLSTTCIAIAVAALMGCEKAAPPAPATPPVTATPPAPPPAPVTTQTASPPSAAQLEAVPAREDFEEEAETQITPANLEKQLEALEKELAAD